MEKLFALLIVALMIGGCSTNVVRGVVTDATGAPIHGARVSVDCSNKTVKTARSGAFTLRVKCEGQRITTVRVFEGVARPVTAIYEFGYGVMEITATPDGEEEFFNP